MCDPVVGLGIATAVLGGLQSIAGYQQERAQHEYQSNVARRQREIAERDAQAKYNYEKALYERDQQVFEDKVALDSAAADRAYQFKQLELQGERDKARAQGFDFYKKSLQDYGAIMARGRSGGVNQYLASDAEREYGRDLARLGTNLGYHKTGYDLEVEEIFLDAQSSINLAASQRMMKPIKDYVPETYIGPGPSAAKMVLGIGQSIVGGVQTGMSLSAPKSNSGDKPKPKPKPKPTPKPAEKT